MFNSIKTKLLNNFNSNITSIYRMIFTGDLDRYKGFHIKIIGDNNAFNVVTPEEFESSLKEALTDWDSKKYRVSWFQIGLKFTHFIPILAKFGYEFHHSKREYVVMNKWLCKTHPYNIPVYSYTNIGVGGVVIDDNDRVLVVKERNFFGSEQMWKFPGGYAEQGEDFGQTAQREVLEETGIQCEFQSIVAFRHFHKFAFDCSDIYIVCHLKPIKCNRNPADRQNKSPDDGLEVTKCAFEIDDCKWIPIQELKPLLSKFNLYVIEKFLQNREKGMKIGVETVPSIVKNIDHKTYSIHTDF